MKKTISIEIPADIVESLELTPEQMKLDLAAYLYYEYNLSLEKAAEVAGITEGVDIYSRQFTNPEEYKRFEQFYNLVKQKGAIPTQEWSVKSDETLNHYFLTYEHIVTTKQMVKRLKAINHAIEAISLELRTSTNGLAGFAEMILAGVLSPEEEQNQLQLIASRGAYHTRLLRTLVDIVKIETGEFRLQFDKMNLKQTIEMIVEKALEISKDKNIDLKCEFSEDLPEIRGDQYRISNLLESFILNARFSDSNVTPEIRIACTYDDSWITIVVIDNGNGLPSDYAEAWTRHGYYRSLEASGVGRLERAVGEYIVEAHNGHLNTEYDERRGTTVTIRLPIAQ